MPSRLRSGQQMQSFRQQATPTWGQCMERTARPVRKCGSGNTTLRFDPYMGAAVLRKLSELACREPSSWLMDPTEPVFVAAAAVLADAKGWLEHYRTPF